MDSGVTVKARERAAGAVWAAIWLSAGVALSGWLVSPEPQRWEPEMVHIRAHLERMVGR